MQFIKEHVPDKRRHNGLRPVEVRSNFFFYFLWKITSVFKNMFSIMKMNIEKTFIEVEQKED